VIAPGKFNNAHGIIVRAIVFSIIIFYFSPAKLSFVYHFVNFVALKQWPIGKT
jgi:glucose uptake protein GlcU